MHQIEYIHATLSKEGEKDIELLIHNYWDDSLSPCVIMEDWTVKDVFGGTINSLEEIFQREVAKHPGYAVKTCVHMKAELPAKLRDRH